MGWVTHYIEKLKGGETITLDAPNGRCMQGRVEPRETVTLGPVTDPATVGKGDVVLCKVGRAQLLHLVKAVQGKRFQISNNKGKVNGWVGIDQIYGKLIRIGE